MNWLFLYFWYLKLCAFSSQGLFANLFDLVIFNFDFFIFAYGYHLGSPSIDSKKSLQGSFFEQKSIHFVLNSVRAWDVNLKFFLSSRIIRFFDFNNRNRLKNIVKKIVNDDFLWVGVTL